MLLSRNKTKVSTKKVSIIAKNDSIEKKFPKIKILTDEEKAYFKAIKRSKKRLTRKLARNFGKNNPNEDFSLVQNTVQSVADTTIVEVSEKPYNLASI